MRVAIVQDSLDPSRGGAETSTHEMAAALAARGHDVSVVCRAAQSPTNAPGDLPYRIEALPPRGAGKAGQIATFLRDSSEFVRTHAFDIIHAVTPCDAAHVYQPRGGLFPAAIDASLAVTRNPIARFVKRAARLFHVKQRILRAAERALLRSPHVYIAPVSQTAAREVAACYPDFPRSRVRPIPNAVTLAPLRDEAWRTTRLAWRTRLGVGAEERVLLFVAHNFALKGLHELLVACARLHGQAADGLTVPPDVLPDPAAPPWRLVVVGRGFPERRWIAVLRNHGLLERVIFSGPGNNMPVLYAGVDALVHPTWYDPCSRVVLEALVCGLPCLTTRLNGAAEALRGPEDGVLIDHPTNSDALTAGLQALLARPLRTEPPETLRADLHMDRHAADLEGLYRAVLAGRPRAG